MTSQGQGTGTGPELPPAINTNVAHHARVYDYWLGGKDNFPADRALAELMIQAIPNMRAMAAANRAFLGRAVRHLVQEAGSASSWTSAPASRPAPTSTSWPRRSPPIPRSCTSTTTRSS